MMTAAEAAFDAQRLQVCEDPCPSTCCKNSLHKVKYSLSTTQMLNLFFKEGHLGTFLITKKQKKCSYIGKFSFLNVEKVMGLNFHMMQKNITLIKSLTYFAFSFDHASCLIAKKKIMFWTRFLFFNISDSNFRVLFL